MSAAIHQGSIVQPGAGRPIAGLGALVKVPAGAFDGRLFMFEGTFEPGMFIPPHTHTYEDEVTVVLSGTLTVDVGGQVSTAVTGARRSASLRVFSAPSSSPRRARQSPGRGL